MAASPPRRRVARVDDNGGLRRAVQNFSGEQQRFAGFFPRAFSGRVERLQASLPSVHPVTRLFTALIQLLAGLVVPSARNSMALVAGPPQSLQRGRLAHQLLDT
jgi:hypothetical protein